MWTLETTFIHIYEIFSSALKKDGSTMDNFTTVNSKKS